MSINSKMDKLQNTIKKELTLAIHNDMDTTHKYV